MNKAKIASKAIRKAENCCLGMDRFIKKGYIQKDIIKGHNDKKIYYKVPTNKMDENGHCVISLILQYCFICAKEIYPA